jgi:plastocyanin
MSFPKFVFAASLALLISACGSNNSNPAPTAPTPAPTPAPAPAPAPAPSSATITIPAGAATAGAAAFGANPMTVATGTTVTFHNGDTIAHTATADAAGGFNTGNINAGGNATVTFSTAGTQKYHCAIHPGMVGTIVVQ